MNFRLKVHRLYASIESNLMFFTVDSLNLLFFKYSLLMKFLFFSSIKLNISNNSSNCYRNSYTFNNYFTSIDSILKRFFHVLIYFFFQLNKFIK